MRRNRIVQFRVVDKKGPNGHCIEVFPTLQNISRTEGGDNILLSIAANCIRAVSKSDGLEGALDRLNDIVINRTSVVRDDV